MNTLLLALYAIDLLPFATFFGIAAYMMIAPFYHRLSAAAFIEFFQKVDPHMKVAAPILLWMQIILTSGILALEHRREASSSLPFAGAALALVVLSLVIAVKGNVPLNRRMGRWDPLNPPQDWQAVRRRWLRFHYGRGMAEVGGFLALLSALLLFATGR